MVREKSNRLVGGLFVKPIFSLTPDKSFVVPYRPGINPSGPRPRLGPLSRPARNCHAISSIGRLPMPTWIPVGRQSARDRSNEAGLAARRKDRPYCPSPPALQKFADVR